MNINEKSSFSSDIAGCRRVPPVETHNGFKWLDSDMLQRQRLMTELDEQADRQRAREDEYWRQRTLARQKQMQQDAQTNTELNALEVDCHALEAMGSRRRTGVLLDLFMDAYNNLKPPQPFFSWVDSMTHFDQLNILQKVMEDRGYTAVVKPEWVRTFERGYRCMYASC